MRDFTIAFSIGLMTVLLVQMAHRRNDRRLVYLHRAPQFPRRGFQ